MLSPILISGNDFSGKHKTIGDTMQYSVLGSSDLKISRVCLGSMTWGVQNNQSDADQQIEYALDHGVNFIDTAELYAIPPAPETYGKTETIIGNWLSRNSEKRSDIILATKIAGPTIDWIRDGSPITGEAVKNAVDASLERLQTDYIDLYQLHWPNRVIPHFRQHWPNQIDITATAREQQREMMYDILQGLDSCIKAGKIRHCGLSDDTPWGIQTYLELSKEHSLPRMVSIQNEFNLLHTKDWPYLIEQCHHENIAYLPWSPLAGGMLTGKYLDGARPAGSRWTLNQRQGLFRDTEISQGAIRGYCHIAKRAGMTPAQLALAWCNSTKGVSSTIIGATSMVQLKEDIEAFEIELSGEIQEEILTHFKHFPVPF